MRTLKTTLTILLLGTTTAVVVGLLLLTLVLPALLQRFACAPYGIRCAVGAAGIRFHVNLTTDVVIEHLTLFDLDGRGVSLRIKRLAVALDIPRLLSTRQLVPTEVRIESPELPIRQLDDGRWNLPALAQEVWRHLPPSTRPATELPPRVVLSGGTLQFGDHRVTDMHAAAEPKPAPGLFEMQARAAIDGRSIRISGALGRTLAGQIRAQVEEDRLRGAMRFRLDYPDSAVAVPEWAVEADGALARGTAHVRYANWPPTYTLTVAEWHADLGTVARHLSLSWLAPFTGTMNGQATTLYGRWPDLPVGQIAATLQDGRAVLPAQQLTITELTGGISLQYVGSRLRLQAALRGKAVELLGQRYHDPSLLASFSVDPATGDVTAEDLRASISGAQIRVAGGGRRWGWDGFDLTTTELRLEPAVLAQLSRWADSGATITTVVDPSIHVWWSGAGRPWNAEMASRSIQLVAAAMTNPARLQRTRIAIQGIGTSERDLVGTVAVEQADLAGQHLRALSAGFELGPDQMRILDLHVAAGNGDVRGRASFSMTAPLLREAHIALSVRGLSPQSLFAPAEKPIQAQGIALDAELAVDATVHGSQPLAAEGRMTIRHLALSLTQDKATPTPSVIRLRGSLPFTLHKSLVTIPTTVLQEDGGLALMLAASLPFGGRESGVIRASLSVPWTETAVLRSALTALSAGPLETTRLAGRFHASLELIDQDYHGALDLQNVAIGLNFFRMDGVTGTIPLRGRIGQGSTATADGVVSQPRPGWFHLTEAEHRAAAERLSSAPTRAPFSLAVGSLAYDPIELRNIEFALDTSEGRIVVQRFAFRAWSGQWSGWGTVEPIGGGITLALLTEELSLRAICDAFPPITGYISGRINGMAELTVPHFALDQARGRARFWAINSPQEGRKISRTLIEQLTGQQIRYFSPFGMARRYDRGVLDVALQAGDLTFHELEISHTILGFKDMDVRVSPIFNKIGLAHLLESVGEAIDRIRSSGQAESVNPG